MKRARLPISDAFFSKWRDVIGEVLGGAMMNLFRMLVYDAVNGKRLPAGIDRTLINEAVRGKSDIPGAPPIIPGADEGWENIEEDAKKMSEE